MRKVACFLSSQVGCSGVEGWPAWAGQACGVQAVRLKVHERGPALALVLMLILG